MTDLRKAAEMALEGFKIIHKGCGAVKEEAQFRDDKDVRDLATEIRKICNKYSKSLRQALAQPEQEPVAWVYNGILHEFDPSEFATSEVKPLYTAPPKREWVGLTEEEFEQAVDELEDLEDCWIQIEAKLKEKNT